MASQSKVKISVLVLLCAAGCVHRSIVPLRAGGERPSREEAVVATSGIETNTRPATRVGFVDYGGRQSLSIQLRGDDRPTMVKLHGQLSLILYPMAEPRGLFHLVDNERNVVMSSRDHSEFISMIAQTRGKIDYYQACMCGPPIGSYSSPASIKILNYIYGADRAGTFYMVGCCFGVGGASPRKQWPDGLMDKLDVKRP